MIEVIKIRSDTEDWQVYNFEFLIISLHFFADLDSIWGPILLIGLQIPTT